MKTRPDGWERPRENERADRPPTENFNFIENSVTRHRRVVSHETVGISAHTDR